MTEKDHYKYGLSGDKVDVEVAERLRAKIRTLKAELVDWQRMRNEAMAVAMANRERISDLEAAILELSPKCQGELGCPGYKLSYDLGLCPPRATLETPACICPSGKEWADENQAHLYNCPSFTAETDSKPICGCEPDECRGLGEAGYENRCRMEATPTKSETPAEWNGAYCPDGLGKCDRGCKVNCAKAIARDAAMETPVKSAEDEFWSVPRCCKVLECPNQTIPGSIFCQMHATRDALTTMNRGGKP